MRLVGWRTWTYVGGVIGSAAAITLGTVIWPGDGVEINQNFYSAAVQILPVLLLALVVRIATTRDDGMKGHRKLESNWEQQRAELDEILEAMRAQEVADADQLERTEAMVRYAERKSHQPNSITPKLNELTAGALFASLVLGAAGIGACLVVLAKGSDSGPLFVVTLVSVVWVVVSLVALETLYFLTASSLRAE